MVSQTSPFRSILESRIGLSAAKNAGARSAVGRLLVFTDDDVVLDPYWLRSYIDLFERIGDRNTIAGGQRPILDDLSAWPAWFDVGALPETGLLDYQTERPLLLGNTSGEQTW